MKGLVFPVLSFLLLYFAALGLWCLFGATSYGIWGEFVFRDGIRTWLSIIWGIASADLVLLAVLIMDKSWVGYIESEGE